MGRARVVRRGARGVRRARPPEALNAPLRPLPFFVLRFARLLFWVETQTVLSLSPAALSRPPTRGARAGAALAAPLFAPPSGPWRAPRVLRPLRAPFGPAPLRPSGSLGRSLSRSKGPHGRCFESRQGSAVARFAEWPGPRPRRPLLMTLVRRRGRGFASSPRTRCGRVAYSAPRFWPSRCPGLSLSARIGARPRRRRPRGGPRGPPPPPPGNSGRCAGTGGR